MKQLTFLRLLRAVSTTFLICFLVPAFAAEQAEVEKKLAALEKAADGRIGVVALNTANNLRIDYRAEERFPMGCTSKMIGVAAILKQSMTNTKLLQEKINYRKEDLLGWAPITKQHLAEGMTVKDLCAAAIMQSDNTAMNLLVKKMGGLEVMNKFAHSIGNKTFRQDRIWPDEALATPDSVLDTSTPAAMADSLQRLGLGDGLATSQRELLVKWLKGNTTGNARIRAGVPKDWVVGDKTGTGFHYGITNDIAIIWPPHCAPLVLAIYFNAHQKDAAQRNDVISAATRIIVDEFKRTDACLK